MEGSGYVRVSYAVILVARLSTFRPSTLSSNDALFDEKKYANSYVDKLMINTDTYLYTRKLLVKMISIPIGQGNGMRDERKLGMDKWPQSKLNDKVNMRMK